MWIFHSEKSSSLFDFLSGNIFKLLPLILHWTNKKVILYPIFSTIPCYSPCTISLWDCKCFIIKNALEYSPYIKADFSERKLKKCFWKSKRGFQIHKILGYNGVHTVYGMYHQHLVEVSASTKKYVVLFTTHSFTNST